MGKFETLMWEEAEKYRPYLADYDDVISALSPHGRRAVSDVMRTSEKDSIG